MKKFKRAIFLDRDGVLIKAPINKNDIVLYASRNALNRLMNNMNSISALSVSVSAPSAPSIATVSYSAASNADASSSAIQAITVSGVNKADISGDVPTYTKPTASASRIMHGSQV